MTEDEITTRLLAQRRDAKKRLALALIEARFLGEALTKIADSVHIIKHGMIQFPSKDDLATLPTQGQLATFFAKVETARDDLEVAERDLAKLGFDLS